MHIFSEMPSFFFIKITILPTLLFPINLVLQSTKFLEHLVTMTKFQLPRKNPDEKSYLT